MKPTVEIFQDFVESIDLTRVVVGVSPTSLNETTVTLAEPLPLTNRGSFIIAAGGEKVRVERINASRTEIVLNGNISFDNNRGVQFLKEVLNFQAGTPMEVNDILKVLPEKDKYMLVYFPEVVKEQYNSVSNAVSLTTRVSPFILDMRDPKWRRSETVEETLSRLDNARAIMIEAIRKYKCFESFNTDFDIYRFAKFGVEEKNKGAVKSIFDDHLSAIRIDFQLNINRCACTA